MAQYHSDRGGRMGSYPYNTEGWNCITIAYYNTGTNYLKLNGKHLMEILASRSSLHIAAESVIHNFSGYLVIIGDLEWSIKQSIQLSSSWHI